jgi:ribosomal-protein-serine acetyltransferase
MRMHSPITTDLAKLRLVPLCVNDVEVYYALVDRNRGHLTQHGDYRSMLTATLDSIREEFGAETTALVLGLWLDGELIGRVDLISKGEGVFVIGYWLDHGAVGHGYMTSACRALIAHAREDLGATAIYAGVTKGNQASEAVLERLGFARIKDMGTYNRFRLDLIHDDRRRRGTSIDSV